MRRFFTTENTEGTEKTLVKLGFRKELFTTEDTEGTEKKRKKRKPEEKKPERVSSVPSVFSVVNTFLDRDVCRGWQPCS